MPIIGGRDSLTAELSPIHPQIVGASRYAYETVAEREGYPLDTLHERRACFWVSIPLCAELVEQGGHDFSIVSRRLNSRWRRAEHVYLRSAETARGPIIVDGTWQQFVPRKNRGTYLPRVAVGTPEEIVSMAQNAGVSDRNLEYWRMPISNIVEVEVEQQFSAIKGIKF
jgi:hypothetical protein